VRRTRFELEKALKRAHILEGLLKAIDVIDEIVAIIKRSKSVDEAKAELMSTFGFTEIQAAAIIEMRLRQLTGLEKERLQAEYDDLEKFIARCQEILASETEQMNIIKAESQEMKAKYGDPRRTEITMSAEEFNPEDFYADDDVVITISHLGYIKRTPLTEFRTQNRGGVGVKGGATRDEDFIEHIYVANMHSTMLFFTQKGLCYRLKVYELPEGTRSSKGRAVQNLLTIDADDSIKTYLNAKSIEDPEYTSSHFVTLVSRNGIIKKTSLEAYSNKRSRGKGIIALTIKEGDALLDAVLTNGSEQIMIASREGRCVRFEESGLRELGRSASGVKGINIDEGDEVIGVITYDPAAEDASQHTVLVVSQNGFGKRSNPEDYRLTNRAGKGVTTMNVTDKTGKVVAIKNVTPANDLMIITQSGLTIRMSVKDIRETGRAAQGVKLINIREGDSIAAVSAVAASEQEETPAAEINDIESSN
ncbi:MAG: DNA gyrase subunit A, partial [Bacteroidales bacterium]|nr:DNA gyrase subunit A [Bacteroidales bacterium]